MRRCDGGTSRTPSPQSSSTIDTGSTVGSGVASGVLDTSWLVTGGFIGAAFENDIGTAGATGFPLGGRVGEDGRDAALSGAHNGIGSSRALFSGGDTMLLAPPGRRFSGETAIEEAGEA